MTLALRAGTTARRLTSAARAVVGAYGRRPGLWLMLAVTLVFAAATIPVVGRAGPFPSNHAAASGPGALLQLAAGIGLLLAGALAMVNQHRPATGVLAVLAGVVWLAVDWVAWREGPAWARSTAMLVTPFLIALLVHLAAAFPSGRVRGRALRAFVGTTYAGAAAVSALWAVFRDPFRERHCWDNCPTNAFVVRPDVDLAATVTASYRWFTIVVGAALAVTCAVRLAAATPTARRTLGVVLVPLGLAGLAQAAYAAALLVDPAETTRKPVFVALFVARAVALSLVAAGMLAATARELRRRRDVARLAGLLGAAPAPGTLRTTLAQSLGDHELQVAYWIPERRRYVDVDGQTVGVVPAPGQVITPIVRRGEPVAAVVHDASLQATHDLGAEIGAASRLAVDNERLLAQARAQINELRSSRRRIVDTGDTARRRLERNLHDGAQQRLLSLAYELQLGGAAARDAGDDRLASAFDAASSEAAAALAELRELAHGIFPVILAEAGLGPALATFADTAQLRVEIGDVPSHRPTGDVEAAVYTAIAETVATAAEQGAASVTLTWSLADGVLEVEARIHGGLVGDTDDLIAATDRVGAVGGTLHVDGARVTLEVPCAS